MTGPHGSEDEAEVEVRLDDGNATQRLRDVENGAVVSRRGVLWRAGIATAAGVAALTSLDGQRAEAASGGNFILGSFNNADGTTVLEPTAGSTTGFSSLMSLKGGTNVTVSTLDVTGPVGATAVNGHSGGSGTGVSGTSASGVGVAGASTSGNGVTGVSTSGTGVVGRSTNASGIGVAATSTSGGGVAITAPAFHLRLSNSATRNAPPGDAISHQQGELVETSSGDLWLCVGSGTPGSWKKVGGPATAGAFHILSNPVRVYDSRPGTQPAVGSKTKLAPNTERTVDLKANGGLVPAGASAALLTLLLINATAGSGNLTVWNFGVKPQANTMVWGPAGGRFTCTAVSALDGAARVLVQSNLATDIVVDVIGYYR